MKFLRRLELVTISYQIFGLPRIVSWKTFSQGLQSPQPFFPHLQTKMYHLVASWTRRSGYQQNLKSFVFLVALVSDRLFTLPNFHNDTSTFNVYGICAENCWSKNSDNLMRLQIGRDNKYFEEFNFSKTTTCCSMV